MNKRKNPLITIITVVLDGKEHLEQTIKSVVSQSYDNLEYIIIDGGSTDGSIEIIKKYKSKIHLWVSEPDKGIYDALNKGIKLANGDLIGICHSGDWLEPNALRIVAESSLGHNIIAGNLKYWKQDQSDVRKSRPSKDIVYYCSILHTATFIKKELFDDIGLYPTDYRISGDYYWFLKAYLKGYEFHYVDENLTNFRAGGLSDRHLLDSYLENNRARRALFNNTFSIIGSYFILLGQSLFLIGRYIVKVIGIKP